MSIPSDPIERLAAAGMLAGGQSLDEYHRQVLAGLSAQEVDTLLAIQQRLADAGDVTGHDQSPPHEDRVILAFL